MNWSSVFMSCSKIPLSRPCPIAHQPVQYVDVNPQEKSISSSSSSERPALPSPLPAARPAQPPPLPAARPAAILPLANPSSGTTKPPPPAEKSVPAVPGVPVLKSPLGRLPSYPSTEAGSPVRQPPPPCPPRTPAKVQSFCVLYA